MPKNPNIKKVLVLGSGPIVIGQASSARPPSSTTPAPRPAGP